MSIVISDGSHLFLYNLIPLLTDSTATRDIEFFTAFGQFLPTVHWLIYTPLSLLYTPTQTARATICETFIMILQDWNDDLTIG